MTPTPHCLNLPTVNYIIAEEFVDFLHIKPKSLKKKERKKCRQFMPNPQYLFAVTKYIVCLCAFPPKNRNPKKPLEKQKKLKK